jgi:hypothetical protein
MELHLTADQQAMIREGIESGRLQRPEDAFEQAMALWEERERRRTEIMLAVETSESSLSNGKGRIVSTAEQSAQLAQDVKRRGAERLAAKNRLR